MAKRKKLLSGTKLTKALDQAIRDLFKLKYGSNPTCFVTGVKSGWFHPRENPRGIQVGHYITRKKHILRWDLKNVYPQSSGSNKDHNTNPAPFSARIVEVYGKERLDYLNERVAYSKDHPMTTGQKRDLLVELQKQIEELTNRS